MYNFYSPVFRKEQYLILTSFKVMYSFLKSQHSLKRILWTKRTLPLAWSNRILGYPTGLLLFRDPESRFISYFHNKFRKAPRKMLAENCLRPENLQHCQRLWLEHIDMDTDNVSDCCQALLETSLESVLAWLPTSYHQDPHTLSQLECLYAQRRWMKIRLTVSRVFLIDHPNDMQAFGQLLGLDTSQKVNQTQDMRENSVLSEAGRETLRQIYRSDFSLYQQLRQAPLSQRSAVLESMFPVSLPPLRLPVGLSYPSNKMTWLSFLSNSVQ